MSTLPSQFQSGFANNMSVLLNLIERRLGVHTLKLDDDIGKPAWQKLIVEDSLKVFSRYYPRQMQYILCPKLCPHNANNTFFIDESFVDNNMILGIQDINWMMLGQRLGWFDNSYVNGMADPFYNAAGFGCGDLMQLQLQNDLGSLANTTVGLQYIPPNMIRVNGTACVNVIDSMDQVPINIIVRHDPSLVTIDPTKMETFENLCSADVATFLVNELKYMDQNNVIFAQLNLHLDDLRNEAAKRDGIIELMRNSFVSPENKSIPIVMAF